MLARVHVRMQLWELDDARTDRSLDEWLALFGAPPDEPLHISIANENEPPMRGAPAQSADKDEPRGPAEQGGVERAHNNRGISCPRYSFRLRYALHQYGYAREDCRGHPGAPPVRYYAHSTLSGSTVGRYVFGLTLSPSHLCHFLSQFLPT